MLDLIRRFGLWAHRTKLAPDKALQSMQCSRPSCERPATEQWMMGCCSDYPENKGKFRPLCTECDIEINEVTLRFFYGDSMNDRLKEYAAYQRMRGQKLAERKQLLEEAA